MWLAGWCFWALKDGTGFSDLFWGRADRDVLEVGVLEEGGVFEPVAEETVHGYVCDPDEGECRGEMPVEQIAGEQENEGKREGVDEIVERGTEARVREVAK